MAWWEGVDETRVLVAQGIQFHIYLNICNISTERACVLYPFMTC